MERSKASQENFGSQGFRLLNEGFWLMLPVIQVVHHMVLLFLHF